jgi:hypothetical protein
VSKIYDAIKRAEWERTAGKQTIGRPGFERRRTERIELRVHLLVYGYGPRHEPFLEEASTLVMNSHGALLVLACEVNCGQKLLLMNDATRREQTCHVVHHSNKRHKHHVVAVTFAEAAPTFWSVAEVPGANSVPETNETAPVA